MKQMLFGTFDDPNKAHQAAQALLDAGMDPDSLSLVCKGQPPAPNYAPTEEDLNYSAPVFIDRTPGMYTPDPMENLSRQSPATQIDVPIEVDTPENAATDDYPRAYVGKPDSEKGRKDIHIHAGYNGIGALSGLLKKWGLKDDRADGIEKECGPLGAVLGITVEDDQVAFAEATLKKAGATSTESHAAYMA